MPCSASSAHVVSSTSNMIAFANAAKYSMPNRITVDVRAAFVEPVTRSTSRASKKRLATEQSSVIARAVHACTPVASQPALISQNSSGGFCE